MHTGRGIFIAIEGTDGSGKGTQCKQLAERLAKAGHDVATFDFPQYDEPSSYFVQQYLNGRYGSAAEVGPYTGSLFYALDRFAASAQIHQALDEGKIVLTNRFVGSNMAHQGTKFQHAEERRGFFIWLDNLEFEMLRIPRPTLSFVLRVPAQTAHTLVGKKGQRAYTDQTHDLHEADLDHLAKAVRVYDEMCQLFPRDFMRVDCTRDNQLLNIATVNDLLWQKIEPLLPPAKSKKGTVSAVSTDSNHQPAARDEKVLPGPAPAPPKQETVNPAPPAHEPGIRISLNVVSDLMASKLKQTQLLTDVSLHATPPKPKSAAGYAYYTPDYMEARVQEQYRAHMDQIGNLHNELVESLMTHLKSVTKLPSAKQDKAWQQSINGQARAAAAAVLPVAVSETLEAYCADEAIEDTLVQLLSDELPEARRIGEQLLAQVRQAAPKLLERVATPDRAGAAIKYQAGNHHKVGALARKYLPDQYANPSVSVQLLDIWPRNELDLVADMLYEHSSLPLKALQAQVREWDFNKKISVFEAYIGERQPGTHLPGRALEKAHYSWDLTTDYSTFRELQAHQIIKALETQVLTPRYGYAVPALVDEADMVDQFEACFDLSLRLHSILQEAGYALEAQYATLRGHKMRWQATHTAREAFRLYELKTTPHAASGIRDAVLHMHEKLQEKHPLLAEAMQITGKHSA